MSCSTNPAQKFRQQKDQSLVRESIQHMPGSSAPQNAGFNQEFASFRGAQVDPQAMNDIYTEMAQAHQTARAGLASPAQNSASPGHQPWAQQFSQMRIGGEPRQPQPQEAHWQSPSHTQVPSLQQHHHAQLHQYQPHWQSQSLAPHHTQSAAAPVPPAADEGFNKAFAAAESRMSALSSQLNEPRVDNMQEVARGVLATVENTTTTDAVAEKMRNSQFIDLMKKMSNKQVVVKDNALVDNQEGVTHDEWKGPKTQDVQIKAPLFDQAQHEREAAQPKPHTPTPLQDPRGGQQPKEDVKEYLHRIGTPESDRPRSSSDMPSAFQAAQQLGPIPVNITDWEEDYSAWADDYDNNNK